MKAHRLERVAEAIREVASETILFELRDPRIKNVTVTRAEVSGDLQHAKIFVSVMGTAKEQELCMHGLRHACGFIQSKLASRLQTRFTPQIRFVLDQGVKKSIEITRLINEALGQSNPASAANDREEGALTEESEPRGSEIEPGSAEGTAEKEPASD